MPNFYFHVVTAYSILRHKGVQLGKGRLHRRLADAVVAYQVACVCLMNSYG
jgi:hypothetical protein